MTGLELVRTARLDLTTYEDGVATFVGREPLTFDRTGRSGLSVHLSLADWERLDRPMTVEVSYVVKAAS